MKELNSELIRLIAAKAQTFVDEHGGKLPDGAEWARIIDINNLMDADTGDLRKANDFHRQKIHQEALHEAGNPPILSETTLALIKQTHLQIMQYESQIATFLLSYAEGQGGLDPNQLKKLFAVQVAPELEIVFC